MRILTLLAVLGVIVSSPTALADGSELLKTQCASCHALTDPEPTGLDHLWRRKGPDLFYAGSKFNREWLAQWLEKPTIIRPGGELYTKHVKPGDKEDTVNTGSLTSHPSLPQSSAEAAAAALMALKAPDGLIAKNAFKGAKVSSAMGAMFFTKLRGCGACHMATPGVGGQSAPELYTAGKRLQADFIYSYIKDPQRIDSHIWMPTLNLSEPDLQRLTGYIVQLSAQEGTK